MKRMSSWTIVLLLSVFAAPLVFGAEDRIIREAILSTASRGWAAFVLSVHGAAVEATNQAGSYENKSWAHIVAPTNRRSYGFDWEDWGRLDALEVMADFTRRYPTDPERVYLTGHSIQSRFDIIIISGRRSRSATARPRSSGT